MDKSGMITNTLMLQDAPVHDWYRFVLSFPPHLVREYLQRFHVSAQDVVLDPFCGTGTTLVECKKLHIPSIGIDANNMAHFASSVKVDWQPDPEKLNTLALHISAMAEEELRGEGIVDNPIFFDMTDISQDIARLRTLELEPYQLLLRDSISPLPLHKTLVLCKHIVQQSEKLYLGHLQLALAQALVRKIGNLRFGPEVGIGQIKNDIPVISTWLEYVRRMANDLHQVQTDGNTDSVVHLADARELTKILKPASVQTVITSPPYPNEKDYTRTTRLESVLLGFVQNKADLRLLKQNLLRSNTRNVYKHDDDERWIANYSSIQQLATTIEAKRIELKKSSGFERLYARVTKLYFGGMAKHLSDLRSILCPGAQLAYVVGDQASYFQIPIRTGQLLAEIAQSLGYELVDIELFRTRFSTKTREHLREEVVILRWTGERRGAA
jgi:DNA methylase